VGWLSVAVILHDTIDMAKDDPNFGKSVNEAVQGAWSKRHGLDSRAYARTPGGGVSSPLDVISQAHADTPQVCVVAYNTGHNLWADDCPQWAIDACISALEHRHGYSVRKKKPKKEVGSATSG
jgi:hypothetical protein